MQKKDKMADGSGFPCSLPCVDANLQAPVIQKVDSGIQRINQYKVDNAISFRNNPLDSDLVGG